jgi:hypothetical protein
MPEQPSIISAKSTANSAESRTVQLMQRVQVASMGIRLFWTGLVFAGCVCVMVLTSRCQGIKASRAPDDTLLNLLGLQTAFFAAIVAGGRHC